MRALFRFTFFGVVVSAGIGLAISAAFYLNDSKEALPHSQASSFLNVPRFIRQAVDHPDAENDHLKVVAMSLETVNPIKTQELTTEYAEPKKSVSTLLTVAPVPSSPTILPVFQPPVFDPQIERKIGRLEETLDHLEKVAQQKISVLERNYSLELERRQLKERDERRSFDVAQIRPASENFQNTDPSGNSSLQPTEGSFSNTLRTRLPDYQELNKPEISEGEGDEGLVINTKNSDIRQVLEMLSEQAGLNLLTSKSVVGPVSVSMNNVDVDTAINAILKLKGFIAREENGLLYVGTVQDFQNMDQALDRINTRIYRPNYITALELQKLILPITTKGIGQLTVSSPSEIDIQPDSSHTGGDNFAGSEVLLVKDYEAVLSQIDQIVAEVDVLPRQVSIEAIIISVKLDDSSELGVDFDALRNNNNTRLVSGSPLSSLAAIDVNDSGLQFGFLDSSLSLFINALETVGDTNVIASPHLLCLNKQKAEILIGSELGYVSTTVTETAATQSVEFLKVGTQLHLRPFIFSDGMIRMEIHPEISTGNVRVEGGLTIPDKDTTEVTTNIMCRDGNTVVIGGLISEDLTTTTSQIPFFGSLPVIGALFRQRNETIDRRELVVLITPRIVGESTAAYEGDREFIEYGNRQATYLDHMSPFGTRHIAANYLRQAKAAWGEGYADDALQLVNKAIHFDTLNREAINLRLEILAREESGGTFHFHTSETEINQDTTDGRYFIESNQGIQQTGPIIVDDYDPGQTGAVRTIRPPIRSKK